MKEKRSGNGALVPLLAGVAVVICLIGGFLAWRSFNNPLRTLKPFPVESYYNHHDSLEGTRFKASLRSSGQIGWNREVGRLVNFKLEPEGQPIVALLPPKFDSLTFESGEEFEAEVMVDEGGLIRVNTLNKR